MVHLRHYGTGETREKEVQKVRQQTDTAGSLRSQKETAETGKQPGDPVTESRLFIVCREGVQGKRLQRTLIIHEILVLLLRSISKIRNPILNTAV